MRALVRGLASTFADAICIESPVQPIDVQLAQQQKHAYVELLKSLVHEVIEIPADNKHPDSCFIEDTAVVVGRTAIIARPGAASRLGEEVPVAEALQKLGLEVKRLEAPATLDGGDVLQLPGTNLILVGLSKRTNAASVEQMQAHLPNHRVVGVSVDHGLHLKSPLTALDSTTLLLADVEAGRALASRLAALPELAGFKRVMVPDAVCANVLLPSDRDVIMQTGCPESEAVLEALCLDRGLALHKLPRMTEFVKADGALTCCSILLPEAT